MKFLTEVYFGIAVFCCFILNGPAQKENSPGIVFVFQNATGSEVTDINIKVGESVVVDVIILSSRSNEIELRSSDEFVFEIDILGSKSLEGVFNESFKLNITGKYLGIESIQFRDPTSNIILGEYTVKIRRVPKLVSLLFTVVLLIWLVISYISMGALITWEELKQRLFPPWRLLIGMLCQFFIMPLITFVLANALPVDTPTAVGIVLVGTCPGGWLSNIFSVLLNVDFILSVTMTFFSSILALVMMPFNIWLYTSGFTADNDDLKTPFGDLFLQLLILVVACVIGRLLGWKFPKFRDFCEKILKPIAVLLVVFGLALGIPADFHMFYSPWPLWVAAFTTPFVGAYFGLSLSRIFAINLKSSVTVALETGVQNALLARTIVYLFYPQPEGDLIGRVQTLTVLITLVEGCVLCAVVNGYRLIRNRHKEDEAYDVDDIKATEAKNGTQGAFQNKGFDANAVL